MSIALVMARKYANGGAVESNPPMTIKKHVNFQGLQISIETPKGKIRRGVDHEGKPWANRMAVDYGYIKRTEGKDGDQVDVFVGPNRRSDKVFIIDQLHHHMEKFDEHKCLVGFGTKKQALTAYHRSYGRKYGAHHTVGAVTELSMDAFKEWLKGGGGKKPISPEVPKYQEGGAVKYTEPTEEDPTRYPYYESEPGPGDAPPQPIAPQPEQPPVMDVTGVGPVPQAMPSMPSLPPDTRPMEPTLQEAQMGQQELPEGLAVNDAGQVFRKDTGEVIPVAPRPGVLPLYRTSEGQIAPAMPKALDIIGSMGAGWSVPTRGAEAILGAGFIKGVKEPQKYGFKGDPFKEKTVSGFELDPAEVKASKQITGTLGTSEGGTFTGFSDGINRYIKEAKSLDHAREEVLASKLYELAGVPAAKMQVTTLKGKPAISSEIISGAQQLSEFKPHQYPNIKGIHEHHPADAWLANWDWGGFGPENYLGNLLVDVQNNVHRIDFGGALSRRGLGGSKGDLFTDTVGELQTLKQKQPSLLKDATLDPNNPTANRIANITDKQISDLVYKSQIANPEKMIDKLVARRDDLAKQYGIEPKVKQTAWETAWKEESDALTKEWHKNQRTSAPPKSFEEKSLEDQMAEVLGAEPVTPKHKYTLKNPKEDADRLLDNYVSHERGEEAFDAKAIADDMYKMAEENPEHVDNVYKHLPKDVQEEANVHLSYKIEKEGDPWSKISLGPTKPAKGAPIGTGAGGTLKLMQLNKTHSTSQIVNSIKAYHKSELTVGKTITEKQKGKVSDMIGAAPAKQIADSIKTLDTQAQNNVLSWLPAAKAANVKALNQVGEFKAAQPIPDIDKIKKSHSLYQVVNAIKNYVPTQSEVPYHAYQSIPKELSKFSPAEIAKEMEPLSLIQKEKVMKWLPESTLEKMAKIAEEKEIKAKSKMFVGQEYFDALENLNWQKWKPSEAKSIRHVFKPSLLKHIQDLGFNPDVTLFKGGKYEGYPKTPSGEPKPLLDPATEPHRLANPDEPAFFLSHQKEVAEAYGQVGTPYIARAPKAAVVDWKMLTGSEDYSSYHMSRLIKAGREKGLDLIVVRDIADAGGYGYNVQTQYAFLNTNVLRGPTAKFDPDKLHLRYPLAGLVGGGLFAYGTLRGQESEQFARGGSVKSTKAEANYRLGTKKEKCAICTMFRSPDSCTAVQGKISPQDTCDYFELSKRKNPMPLKKGSSQSTISQNIREFHTGKTYSATKAKFGKARADKQAVAVALSNARKYARGGGLIRSHIPGRTDKIPMNVRNGSYVIPADIPSAIGQGNTDAGANILGKMFKLGPYGSGATGAIPRSRTTPMPRMNLGFQRMNMMHGMRPPRLTQDGGEQTGDDENVPIIAAGGEMIIPPERVEEIGNGNLTAGYKVLGKFVLRVRKEHINTLKKLKPPKK